MEYKSLHNESVLLQRIAEGHEPSFNTVYRFYLDRVYSTALRIVKQEDLADEIVQDVFTKLWNYGPDLIDIDNLYFWLRRICRNMALNILRHNALLNRVERDCLAGWREAGRSDTDDLVILDDIRKVLNTAIESLPAQQRRVYIHCHQDGYSYEETAALLQLSKLTVHSHMKQALRNIRRYVTRYYLDLLLVFLGSIRLF